MRIAQLSTPFISVPPKDYGGTELVVYNLTEELVKAGHEVTLFAPGDSQTSATLYSPFPQELDPDTMKHFFSPLALKLFWEHSLPALHHTAAAFERANEFDVIHNHLHYMGLFFEKFVKTPVVHTYHGDFISAWESLIERMLLKKYKDSNWIAISESQKNNCPLDLNFVAVIPHGIDLQHFAFDPNGSDHLVWLGRITAKKGVKEAIDIATKIGKRIHISGIVNQRDQEYFNSEIQPSVNGSSVIFEKPMTLDKKSKFLGNARAFIYPVLWEEPFGLVMIEAMACGTPVIAFKRGAVPEIVIQGETGFVVEPEKGAEGLIQAVETLYAMPENDYKEMRRKCRSRVEQYFTTQKMAAEYEKIYSSLLKHD